MDWEDEPGWEDYVRELEIERRRPVPLSPPRGELDPDPQGPSRLAEATREALEFEHRRRAEAQHIETT